MDPAPVLDSSEPPRLRAGAIELTLVGSGFVNGSTERVSQPGGVDVPLNVKASEPQRLTVELNADDVVAPGPLLFVVSNPSPGGGTSRILPVAVDPLEDTTQQNLASAAEAENGAADT